MEKPPEERIALLEGQCDAYMLIIAALIADAWPNDIHRIERRETICEAVERTFARVSPGEFNHQTLQQVLGEVERLFRMAGEID
jgi:hypothetical protein